MVSLNSNYLGEGSIFKGLFPRRLSKKTSISLNPDGLKNFKIYHIFEFLEGFYCSS